MLRTFLDRVFEFVSKQWPFLLLGAGVLLIFMRLHWSLRVLAAALVVATILIAILGAGQAIYDLVRQDSNDPRFVMRLRNRAQQAKERILKLNTEVRGIERKMDKLKLITDGSSSDASGKQWGKSLALLQAYEQELTLRNTKIDFYRRSLKSLNELERKWEHERDLNAMQRELDRLRKPNDEDAKRMETLKAELDYESKLLTTYRELSKKIDKADTVEGAQELRTDLDKLLD